MITIHGKSKESTVTQKSSLNHGTYHLADLVDLYEPQRTNNFEFIVPASQLTDMQNLDGDDLSTLLNIDLHEALRLSVKSIDVPHFSQKAIEIKRGNSTLKFAGEPTFDSGSLTIYDFIGNGSKEILLAWQNLSYNTKTEKIGLGSDYKKECYLVEYTPDYQEVRRWKMMGCWISKISEGKFDTDSADKRTIDATIEYDRALLETDVDSTSLY